MLSSILSLLKRALSVGAQTVPSIVSAYNPALGALVGTVLNAVVVTEGGGFGLNLKGVQKEEAASLAVAVSLPAIEKAFSAAGKPVANQSLFAAGIAKIQSGVVDIMNSTGDLTK